MIEMELSEIISICLQNLRRAQNAAPKLIHETQFFMISAMTGFR